MSTLVVSVENLSKRYLVGHRDDHAYRYTALRDVLGREIHNFARKTIDFLHGRQIVQGDSVEEFWALRDVNFELHQGEVLGIIGRNGAGKSTLLKILSRITDPTSGRIALKGRVGSLLEVGTGFHPELTGRENIYLNGTILGMSRGEIRKKFDEIVNFADVERFLDTPVKRYSSGMYVRLAFAVAAHLQPEILIVDEVLAVGDIEFQKKCLGKMDEVARGEGRTVLFVSHNMSAVAELARRTLLLERGIVAMDGETSAVLSHYLSKGSAQPLYVSAYDELYEHPHISRAEVSTSRQGSIQRFGEELTINVWVRHLKPTPQNLLLGIEVINHLGMTVTNLFAYPPEHIFGQTPGEILFEFRIHTVRLYRGHFRLRINLTGEKAYDVADGVCAFEVVGFDREPFRIWPSDACAYQEEFSVKRITSDVLTDQPVPG